MALRSVNSSSSAASSSCSSSKKEEETQETSAFKEYYTLGCMAEESGLISDSSKYFKKALSLVKIEKNRSTLQARLDFLDSAFCPSDRSKEVRLINFSVLNHSQIKPFLHQNLLVLVFHNCSNIINETIVLVAERCFQLQKLSLNNCSKLMAIERGLIFKKVLVFRELENLDISDCSQLKTVRLHAPNLKLFETYDNRNLIEMVLEAPLSTEIVAKGSLHVNIDLLEKRFGIENLVRIVKTLDSDFCKFLLKILYPSMKEIIKNVDFHNDEIIPARRLIKAVLEQIDGKEDFLQELELSSSFSELRLTEQKSGGSKKMPPFFGVTLQQAYNAHKPLNERDIAALEDHPMESGMIIVAKALQTNFVITKLDLSSCNIGKGIAVLAEAFKTNLTITHLNLRANQIESEGMFFAQALKINATLKYLNLSSNKLGILAIMELASALEINASLIYLNLSGNKITFFEGLLLASGLKANQTLTHLDLRSNQIGFFGMAMMMQALEKKRVLTHLDLQSNQIECNNAKRIKALKTLLQNCALIELDLSENQIIKEAQTAIKEVEESKPGLKIKVTFSEFCEKQIESLKEEETSDPES